MTRLGGIPVNRDAPQKVVADAVARMRAGEVSSLVVTPDSTRSGHTHWRSGFYRIARETGIPATLGYVDRTTMTTGLGPTFALTGDVSADMERVRAFYADKAGARPGHRVEPQLREELAANYGCEPPRFCRVVGRQQTSTLAVAAQCVAGIRAAA